MKVSCKIYFCQFQRAITPKICNPELRFLCSACRFMLLYSIKFHENISNGFWVTERTRFCDRQSDGQGNKNMSPNPTRGDIILIFTLYFNSYIYTLFLDHFCVSFKIVWCKVHKICGEEKLLTDVLGHYVQLLSSWCDATKRYMDQSRRSFARNLTWRQCQMINWHSQVILLVFPCSGSNSNWEKSYFDSICNYNIIHSPCK